MFPLAVFPSVEFPSTIFPSFMLPFAVSEEFNALTGLLADVE